jgi:hypothetical protein
MFQYLFEWWTFVDGISFCKRYEESLQVAHEFYKQNYGLYKDEKAYIELTADEKIELEQFVRNNPDFMPKEVYYSKLIDMRIISWDEYYALKEAAKKAQDK